LILDDLTEEIANPNSVLLAEAHLMRGTFRHLLGFWEGTLSDYDAVISNVEATNEQVSAAWIKKGLLYAEEPSDRNLLKSLLCFQKAKLSTAENPDLYFAQAQVLLLRKADIPSALTQIEKACELAPDFELFNRWKLYIRLRVASKRHSEEGIESALLEFHPPIGSSTQPEILRVDICILSWMGQYSEAHLKLDTLIQMEPEDPRIYLGKILLHEMIYSNRNDQKTAFDLLQETMLNYGRVAQIHKMVGDFALKNGLLDPAVDCYKKALAMSYKYENILHLVKLEKTAISYGRVVAKFGLDLANYTNVLHIPGPGLAADSGAAVALTLGNKQGSSGDPREF